RLWQPLVHRLAQARVLRRGAGFPRFWARGGGGGGAGRGGGGGRGRRRGGCRRGGGSARAACGEQRRAGGRDDQSERHAPADCQMCAGVALVHCSSPNTRTVDSRGGLGQSAESDHLIAGAEVAGTASVRAPQSVSQTVAKSRNVAIARVCGPRSDQASASE